MPVVTAIHWLTHSLGCEGLGLVLRNRESPVLQCRWHREPGTQRSAHRAADYMSLWNFHVLYLCLSIYNLFSFNWEEKYL